MLFRIVVRLESPTCIKRSRRNGLQRVTIRVARAGQDVLAYWEMCCRSSDVSIGSFLGSSGKRFLGLTHINDRGARKHSLHHPRVVLLA